MMSFDVAIIGEAWEAAFARATTAALARLLPTGTGVLTTPDLVRTIADVSPVPPCVIGGIQPGFVDHAEARGRALAQQGTGRGLLLVSAGAMPDGDQAMAVLGAPFHEDRVVEWVPGGPVEAPSVLRFRRPPHEPPTHPHHSMSRTGKLAVHTVDTGTRYFQGLAALGAPPRRPLWSQYGPGRPVFTVNTNDWAEPAIDAHDDYAVLGSGLLGLRLVAESRPAAGARVVVYDINPAQLAWTRWVLESAARTERLEDVVAGFRENHPDATIRPIFAHEGKNAARQCVWYAEHRRSIADVFSRVECTFLECDLLSDPRPLLSWVKPDRRLFFMYLDLFLVWHVEHDNPWVEHHAGIAASLEAVVQASAGGRATFLPRPSAGELQLQPDSPFLDKET